jgi:AraC-like DNA-binding protein
MASKRTEEVLIIENLADFEKKINRDYRPYDINMMVMPGTLEDKHKDVDPERGIPALRRQFNLIYLLEDGVHDVHLGADYRWLRPNDLVIVPENFLYASSNVRNCRGYCMHFKTEFIQPLLKRPFTEEFPFFDLQAEHIVNVSDGEADLIRQSFRDIIREYERFSPEKEYLLRSYIQILLLRVREIYRPRAHRIRENASRATQIAGEFRHLLEKNFRQRREVRDYARELHITPKYLCEAVKEATGKSPREIIRDLLLLESRALLASTGRTVAAIAQELGFEDPPHFTRFIRQHTGLTPVQLRKKG